MTIPPPSPRHISEISFDTINDEYNKLVCPKSPRKQQIQDQDTLNSRKFWLSTAHDLKKLHDMQKVYLYLQYAQLEPILNEKRLALYFNRWVKEIPRRRWRHFYQRLVQQKYVEEYTSEADRIKYTRMKLSAKKYKSDTFGADLDYLTKIAISTTDKLNCLTSKPEIPIKTIPPEVLSHRSRRSSKRGLNEDDLHMLNELKKKKSPKKKGKRVRKRILSPTQKQKQQVETRDIDLDYEYDDNDYNIDYDDDEFNEVLENQEQAEEPVKETQKKGISKWMFLAVFLIFLVAGTAAFIFISPPRAFNALKTGLFGSSALAASSADGEINLDTESLNDTIINENVQADITESEENETGDLQKVLDGVEKVIENSENQTEAQNETENALENETAEQAETDNENTETVQQ